MSQQGVRSLELPRLGWTDERQAGSEATRAFVTEQYVRWREPLFGFIRKRLRNDSDAEELTQEVFVRLYAHVRAGHVVDQPRAWLYKVARHLVIDVQRRHLSHPLDVSMHDLDLPSTQESQEIALVQRNYLSHVKMAIARLPPLQHQCVMLRAQGLRLRQIATTLDRSISTVASSLSRATKTVQRRVNNRPKHAIFARPSGPQ